FLPWRNPCRTPSDYRRARRDPLRAGLTAEDQPSLQPLLNEAAPGSPARTAINDTQPSRPCAPTYGSDSPLFRNRSLAACATSSTRVKAAGTTTRLRIVEVIRPPIPATAIDMRKLASAVGPNAIGSMQAPMAMVVMI